MRNEDKLLNVLRGWIGYSEKNGKFKEIIDTYNADKPLPRGYTVKYTDEWCATTVSAAGIKSGLKDIIGKECSCEQFINIFKQKGIWIEDGSITPKKGDIILYNWDDSTQPNNGRADHIGVVEDVSSGVITVIEGNRNEMVARRKIYVGNGYIRGFARPNYSGIQAPVTQPAPSGSYNGNSIVDYLRSVKQDTSFAHRAELAKQYGIADYKGTAEQNLALLKLLRDGKPAPQPQQSNKLAIDGSWGKATTRATQQYLGTKVDGIVSRQPQSNKKYLYGASTSSWHFVQQYKGGSYVIKALQRLIGTDDDGYFGKNSVRAFQEYLRRTGYYTGELDNSMGKQTVKAWQSYLNDHLK